MSGRQFVPRKEQRKAMRLAKKQRKNEYFQKKRRFANPVQVSKPERPVNKSHNAPKLKAAKHVEPDVDEEILSDSDAYESYSEAEDCKESIESEDDNGDDSFLALIDKAFESGKLTKAGLLRENGDVEDSEFEIDGDSEEEDQFSEEGTYESDMDDEVSPTLSEPISKSSKQDVLLKIDLSDESVQKLNKQLQSLVNKLSASNLIPISNDFEALLRNNKRKMVVELLTEILLSSIVRPDVNLLDSFAICFASFAFIAYQVIGIEFGAHLVERLIEAIDALYTTANSETERSLVNCMSFCSFLYDLQVVSHRLICDLMQQSAAALNEIDVEIILKLFRSCGAHIRRDDIHFLPALLAQVQQQASSLPNEKKSSRFRFMLETLDELKDSKRKLVASLPIELESIRKSLKTLMTLKSLSKIEPLRISLEDIRNIGTKGKWWLVGSSWHPENNKISESKLEIIAEKSKEVEKIDDLARSLRMNTELRRTIFSTLITSDDYSDAFDRLLALKLLGKQERDIVLVLLHCCGQEKLFNPFYAMLAGKLVNYKRSFLITFQYALWDALKQLSEFSLRKLSNLAQLYGHLVAAGSFPLASLRKANFIRMSDEEQAFWQLLFMTAFTLQPPASAQENMAGLATALVEIVEQNYESKAISPASSSVRKPRLLTENFNMNEFDDDFFAAQSKITNGQSSSVGMDKLEECKALRSGLIYFLDTYFINATELPFADSLIEPCRYQARKLKQSLWAIDI